MNKFIVIGRLTKEIEIKTSESGRKYISFTVAVNHKLKATFIRMTAFGDNLCKFLSNYHNKGDFVSVLGHMEGGTNKENNYRIDFVVDEAYFCKNRPPRRIEDYTSTEGLPADFKPVEIEEELPF